MSKKISKNALAALIAERAELSAAGVLIVLNALDDVIAEQVRENEPGIYLDNIGTIRRVLKPPTRKYIPSKGETVDVPERVTVQLRPSKTLIERVR